MTAEPHQNQLRMFMLAIALIAIFQGASAPAQTVPAGSIACIPDRPVVHAGESLRVSAFVIAPAGTPLQFAWTATTGQISGTGHQVTWRFQNAMSGIYTSTVTVTNGSTKLGECSVQVTVLEAERGQPDEAPVESRETARAFLVMGAKEEAGYGLYSYLLFGSPPTDSSRPRYLKSIQAYLTLIQTVTDMRAYRPANKLNITYLPVKVRPPDSPSAEWLLANYDYARARVLLDLQSSTYQTGPYFLSALTPLSTAAAIPHNHLFQDLSLAPAEPQDLLSWWIRAFLNQSAQEQFWQPQSGEMLALRLRTMVSVEAVALPDVVKQLGAWIKWAQ